MKSQAPAYPRLGSGIRESESVTHIPQLPSRRSVSSFEVAPIFLDESAEAYEGIESASASNPIGAARTSNKGFLPLTNCQYLELLDCVGRWVRTGKQGHIPQDLPPILDRLNLQMRTIVDSVVEFFGSRSAFREAPSPG